MRLRHTPSCFLARAFRMPSGATLSMHGLIAGSPGPCVLSREYMPNVCPSSVGHGCPDRKRLILSTRLSSVGWMADSRVVCRPSRDLASWRYRAMSSSLHRYLETGILIGDDGRFDIFLFICSKSRRAMKAAVYSNCVDQSGVLSWEMESEE